MDRIPPQRLRLLLYAFGLLAALSLVWTAALFFQATPFDIGRSDFTSTFVGARLLIHDWFPSVYSLPLQEKLHHALIAPDAEGNLPFVNPPFAALLAAPLALLSLDTAYRIFALIQAALLACAIAITVWGTGLASSRMSRGVLAIVCFGTPATIALVLLGQWDGLCAIGIALGCFAYRKGRMGLGTACILVPLLATKPHLAIGLVLFFLVCGRKNVRKSTLLVLAVLGLLTVFLLGVGGTLHYASLLLSSTTEWPLASFEGLTGLFGSWFGNSPITDILSGIAMTVAAAAIIITGRQVDNARIPFADGVVLATVLSLLLCPHLLLHDLVLLAPLLPWWCATSRGKDRSDGAALALSCWALLDIAELLDFGRTSPYFPGKLVPFVLAGSAVVLWRAVPKLQGSLKPDAAPA